MADEPTRERQTTPAERIWTMPTTVLTAEGEEVPALENTRLAMDEVATILQRLGGTVTVISKRVDLDPQGRFPARTETEALVIRWQSFVPKQPRVAVAGAPAAEEPTEAPAE